MYILYGKEMFLNDFNTTNEYYKPCKLFVGKNKYNSLIYSLNSMHLLLQIRTELFAKRCCSKAAFCYNIGTHSTVILSIFSLSTSVTYIRMYIDHCHSVFFS